MADTPERTRRPNGIIPPQSETKYGADSVSRPYDPSAYAGIGTTGSGDQRAPRPALPKLPHTGSGSKVGTSSDHQLNPESPTQTGKKDPRWRHEPGSAASFYGGTPPAFPPPPEAVSPEAQAYGMSGALPPATSHVSAANAVSGAPGPLADAPSVVSMAGPAAMGTVSSVASLQGRERGLRAARLDTESALREYMHLQQRVRLGASNKDKDRMKRLATRALTEVKELRKEIGALVKKKEGGRIGRFIVGGIVAGTIPLIKRFFKRPPGSRKSGTEYAYGKSQSMIQRILSGLRNAGWTASIFMFVLAALYVFQAEVMIQVARTVHKRLKRLLIKMEEGERLGKDGMVVMDAKDLDSLRGWRWRVLLWSK